MTVTQAEQAAQVTFDQSGDGYLSSSMLPAGFPHDYIGVNALGNVRCVGALGSPADQIVATSSGVTLGDPVSKILSVYGSQATFVPPPTTGGITDYGGYVVDVPGGQLVFVVANQRVTEIAGGSGGLGPNSCTG